MKSSEKNNEEAKRKTISASIEFPKKDVILSPRNSFTGIIIKKGIIQGNPGDPALPWQKIFISLPWNATDIEIQAKAVETITIAEGIIIEPVQPNVPALIGTQVRFVEPNKELYASSKIWPETNVKFINIRRTGKNALAETEVCPLRYHFQAKKLELMQKIELTLSYREKELRIEKPKTIAQIRHSIKFAERVKKLAINPQDVFGLGGISFDNIPTDLTVYPNVDHVIITSALLAQEFELLANWRTLFGLRSRVVNIEDIMAGTVPDTGGTQFWQPTGYTDGGTRDTAEAIRNFIKWASINWLTDYVLLGGDTEIIPVRQALHTDVGTFSYGNINDPMIYPDWQLASSSTASSQKPTSPASNVRDKNLSTVWECETNDPTPWIRVSVGVNKPTNCVRIVWGANHASSYSIQVSSDGTNWTNVFTTNSGVGGTEDRKFNAISANFVRLQINSGTNFSIALLEVYGPNNSKWGGVSYQINNTTTRIYLSAYMNINPLNELSKSLIIIKEGSNKGLIIPYDVTSDDTKLGWYFINSLTESPSTVSNSLTSYVEIRGPAIYHSNPFALKEDYNYIPADLYFADVADSEYPIASYHDWDNDNNGVYGERYGAELDSVNGFPDVYIGRASVETTDEASNFVNKIIHYEKYTNVNQIGLELPMPKDFAVSVILGSEDYDPTHPPVILDGSAAGKEDIRHMLQNNNPNLWTFTRLYQDMADVPAADQGPDLSLISNVAMVNAIKKNSNIVSLSSHGSSVYLCSLTNSDVDDIVNFPGIWYGNSCLTNKIDTTPGEAFSETTMLNIHGGAVAYVGNTRFGWTGDAYIEKAFWEEMLDSSILGKMFQEAKIISSDWEKYSLNLLGDPAMRVWSDFPQNLNVTHAATINTGNQDFDVVVTSSGNPVANATVCLTMTGLMFAKGETDATGKARINISPPVNGTMYVAVSGKNMIPYIGCVTIKLKLVVVCPPNIICRPAITCRPALTCGKSIFCKQSLSQCGEMIIPCGSQIRGCIPSLGCIRLQPFDWEAFKHVRDIWGIRDINDLVKIADTEEFKNKLDQLPPEIKKSIQMLLDRIRSEAYGESQ